MTATLSRRLPLGIWALGFGSLLMDSSSELVHSLLPVFLVGTLGVSVAAVGVIEGVAEATAAITKVFSGTLSDWLRRRKPLVIAGYALAALTKPVFPLATAAGSVFAARFVDRVGKGIRGAPRDALVADIVDAKLRGAAYGLRQALDSVGAVVGPLLALIFMALFAGDVRNVLWVSVVPAGLCLVVLIVFVREPERSRPRQATAPLRLADARRLPFEYWLVVLFGAVLALARFSEAFLVLRGGNVGLAVSEVPIVMIIMNVVYAAAAYPAGAAADRIRPGLLLLGGLVVLIAADLVLASAASPRVVFVGAACWGLHMALTQGVLAKLVADASPEVIRGSAFGIFNLVGGVATLGASVLAGTLWSLYGPRATFLGSALLALVAVGGFGARLRARRASG
jgi:MFS family permease